MPRGASRRFAMRCCAAPRPCPFLAVFLSSLLSFTRPPVTLCCRPGRPFPVPWLDLLRRGACGVRDARACGDTVIGHVLTAAIVNVRAAIMRTSHACAARDAPTAQALSLPSASACVLLLLSGACCGWFARAQIAWWCIVDTAVCARVARCVHELEPGGEGRGHTHGGGSERGVRDGHNVRGSERLCLTEQRWQQSRDYDTEV